MDDLDICKRIAEIEGLEPLSEDEWELDGNCMILVNDCSEFYNPLTDDALCFQLMVKYKIDVLYMQFKDDEKYCAYKSGNAKSKGADKSPNKAICLAIIEANNETTN